MDEWSLGLLDAGVLLAGSLVISGVVYAFVDSLVGGTLLSAVGGLVAFFLFFVCGRWLVVNSRVGCV